MRKLIFITTSSLILLFTSASGSFAQQAEQPAGNLKDFEDGRTSVKGFFLTFTLPSQNLGTGISYMYYKKLGYNSQLIWGYDAGLFVKDYQLSDYRMNVVNLNLCADGYLGYDINKKVMNNVSENLDIVPKIGLFYAFGYQRLTSSEGVTEGGNKWYNTYGYGLHIGVDFRYHLKKIIPFAGIYYNVDFDGEQLGVSFYAATPLVLGVSF